MMKATSRSWQSQGEQSQEGIPRSRTSNFICFAVHLQLERPWPWRSLQPKEVLVPSCSWTLNFFQKKTTSYFNGLLLWRLLSPWEVSKHFNWCWASLATAHWRKCKTLWRGSMSDLAVSILVCTCTFLVWFLTAPVECEVLAIRCGRGSRLGQMRLVWQSSSTKLSKSLAAGETCRIFTVSKQKYLDA